MLNATIQRIRDHLAKPGVTKKDVAAEAGLHANTLTGLESDDWNPTADTLRKLEAHIAKVEAASLAVTDASGSEAPPPFRSSENSTLDRDQAA